MSKPTVRGSKGKAKPAGCPHCRSGAETFRYLRVYKFDVTLARELIADGREPVEVEDESVRLSLEDCKIYPDHVDHVDPKYPGIIAHVEFPNPDGELIRGHVLIDGNHRSARCVRDGLPFFAYLLTVDESRTVLLRGPKVTPVPAAAG